MRILLGSSTKTIFLIIFAIILCSYTSYTTAQKRVLSHNEQVDYGAGVIPRIWDSKALDDGTMIIRVVRKNATTSINRYLCFYEMFSLRIINLDGTVVEKDLKLPVQAFNYCVFQDNTGLFVEYMRYYLIKNNQILVTYHNATDVNNPSTYVEWGMLIDYDGNVLTRSPIGTPYVDNNLQLAIPIFVIKQNINREKGFLRYGRSQNSNLEWQQFKFENDGTIAKSTSGELVLFNSNVFTSIMTMSTVDEGYAIAFANSTNTFNATNPLSPQGQLFILPIGFDKNAGSPLLLYQTPIPNLSFVSLFCDIAYVGVGQVCTLTASQPDPTGGNLPPKNFYIKINFLSSGSVTSFQVINRLFPIENNANIVWKVDSLSYGGYLLSNTFQASPNQFVMYGYLFDETNTNPINWDLPEPEPIGTKGVYQILPNNNTLLVSQLETDNSWRFDVIDLPKFDENRDRGYSNLNVESTYPEIKSTINPNIQKNITINFYDPVELSDGRLSIYQLIDNKPYLRQHIDDTLCTLENDGRTVNAKILESTFSVSSGMYYIKMDNNFVVDKSYKEPLLGIRDNVWNFNVEQKKVPFAPSTTGLLRLTPDGTRYFDSLTSDQQSMFFNTLLNDLSNAIPVSRSRLTSNEKTQLDTTLNEKQYLISIGIKETRDDNDLSVVTVVDNIKTMVTNKALTSINDGMASQYLDQTYSFNPTRKYNGYILNLIYYVYLYINYISIFLYNSEFMGKI
jgi:hypothetical protein